MDCPRNFVRPLKGNTLVVNKVKRMQKVTLLLTLVAIHSAFFTACTTQNPTLDSVVEQFAEQIKRDVEEDNVGSITFGIYHEGKTVYSDAFGVMDRKTSRPAQPQHIYRTGSISKSITAVLMMLLVQDGLVRLDDPVSKFLPEIGGIQNFQGQTPAITLQQLATHTSGLIREPEMEGAASGPIDTWEDKILSSIPHTYFQANPGDEYSYSNIGYGILGLALSRAVEVPFMNLVEERIFHPLEMTSTTFIVDQTLSDRLASGYVYTQGINQQRLIDGSTPLQEHSGRGYKVPNGGVYSTAADLAKLAELMSGSQPQLLAPKLLETMMSIQTPESDTDGYGLGFSLSLNKEGLWWVSHGGSVAGYNAYLLFQPDSRLSIVLLRNYSGGMTNLGAIAREVGDELLGLLSTP